MSLLNITTKLLLSFVYLTIVSGELASGFPEYPYNQESISNIENEISGPDSNDAYRLPKSLNPVHYKIYLQPLINGNLSIMGHVDITVEVLEETSSITLNLYDITPSDDSIEVWNISNSTGEGIPVSSVAIDYIHQLCIIYLKDFLLLGESYILSLDFEGSLATLGYGFYKAAYTDEEGNEVNTAITEFETDGSRRAFPCFDEPSFKATFEVYLGREESYLSISNMPLIESVPIEGQEGWYWDRFENTVLMSTYLLCFIVCDFPGIGTSTARDIPITAYSRSEVIGNTQLVLDKGPKAMTFFEEYLGVPYTLPKMDMVASKQYWGAMENWGLILYSEDYMLFDPAVQTEADKQEVTLVIAHELSHQWFGDLVTLGWWSDTWLNEGFAQYMENVGADATDPSWELKDQFVVDIMQHVLEVDSTQQYSHPVIMNVSAPSEAGAMFDDISYEKGGSLCRMINSILTEGSFVRGLTSYLLANQYGNVFQDELFIHLTNSGHEDETLPVDMTMKQIMDTWTLQAGYPVITVNRTSDGTTATVSQQRFWSPEEVVTSETWWVPLTYTSQDNPDFEITQPALWMKDSETEISLESLPGQDQWVIFNLQETGYYRVNYDDNNWGLLQQQLESDPDVIHPLNRAQILDDYADLSRAGYLSYDSMMDMFSYLHKETRYVPLSSALNNLNYIRAMIVRTDAHDKFKNFILHLLLPSYDTISFEFGSTSNLVQPEIFKNVLTAEWICSMGYGDCINKAQGLFRTLMKDPHANRLIDPNFRKTVYCTSIKFGSQGDWEFLWNRYQKSNIISEKKDILDALGCSQNQETLNRYLEMTLTEKSISKEAALRAYESVAKNPVGGSLFWNFLKQNLHTINEKVGDKKKLLKLIKVLAEHLNTEEELTKMVDFEKNYSADLDKLSLSQSINQVIHKIKTNTIWMHKNYKIISRWLEDNGY